MTIKARALSALVIANSLLALWLAAPETSQASACPDRSLCLTGNQCNATWNATLCAQSGCTYASSECTIGGCTSPVGGPGVLVICHYQ